MKYKMIIGVVILMLMVLILKKITAKKNVPMIIVPGNASNDLQKLFFASSKDYVQKLLPIAKRIEQDKKIPYLFLIAQTALETGWGKSSLVKNAGNFGGIKAVTGQPYVTELTTEYVKDPSKYPTRIKSRDVPQTNGTIKIYLPQNFARFNSLIEGLNGYIKILLLPRYSKAFQYKDTFNFATEIKKGGYATDPNYVSKIEAVVKNVKKIIEDNKFLG